MLTEPSIHLFVDNEINGLTAKAAPTTADLVVIEDAAAGFAKKKATLASLVTGTNAPTQVSATDAPTTTSVTDISIPVLVQVPGAGNYVLWASIQWSGPSSALVATFSIYINGVQVAGSERGMRVTAGSALMVCSMVQYITGVTAGQVVEIRWRTSAGTLITGGNRNQILWKAA
jgi:hypothetical protein